MAEISKITLPSGTTYDIKDATAREAISNLNSFEYFICTEAANTPKDVTWDNNGTTVTGTLVASDSTLAKIYLVPDVEGTNDIYREYMTIKRAANNYVWEQFGNTSVSLGDLGDLAFKDTASASYKPAGTVSQPTFSGNSMTATATYTPAGSVTQPTFSGTQGSVSVSGSYLKPTGVDIGTTSGTGKTGFTYISATPTSGTFGGTQATITTTGTPSGSISVGTGTANYTPEGTVSKPTITVTPSTTTKYVASSATGGGSVTAGSAAACTLPALATSVENENLTLSWSAGSFTANTPTAVTLPSFTSQTIATGISSASSSQPTFSGTGVELTFAGDSLSSTGTYTPAGSVTIPAGTSSTKYFSVATSNQSMTSTGNFTPEGTVSRPTFSGTEATISATGTPSGTVSQPTFTGTQATITVS